MALKQQSWVVMKKDFLDEVVAARTKKNPKFPDFVAEAQSRRDMAHRLAVKRQSLGYSQTLVAARMGTAASVVSKLESGGDVKVSTLQRYCAAIGQTFPPAATRNKSAAPI
jgi:ribosome-binding protein aMBF1 (putative translation factor)